MNNLFDNTEKLVKFNRSLSQQLQIKYVLNPYTQSFIDVQLANTLGILYNGYYRNCYGELIPLHLAANKGFIEYTINEQIDFEEMEIEYRSQHFPITTNLLIRQVYDYINQCMITFQQALDYGYLDTELFIYSCSYISIPIHEAFFRGLIIGELRTNITEQTLFKQMININEKNDFEYENLILSLKNIIKSINEFIDTINIIDECQLTSDGYIQHKITGKCYILTQAIELGLVSFKDYSQINQFENSKNHSIFVNYTTSSETNITHIKEDLIPKQDISFFSDTFIFDLLKTTDISIDEVEKDEIYSSNINQFLS